MVFLGKLIAGWPVGLWLFYGYFGWRYRIGNATDPGPGLFPFAVAVLGLIVCILLLATHQGGATVRQRNGWRGEERVILFCCLMALNVLLTPYIGQVLAIGVFAILSAWLMGIRKWPHLFAIGIGTSAAVFLIFGYILGTPLIEGLIFSSFLGF